MSRMLKLAAGVLVSVVCVWLSMRDVRPAEVWGALKQANYLGFAALAALTLFGFWLRAFRWRWLLSTPKPVPIGALYSATMIGFMANNLLPFRLGEFVRAWALGRSQNLSKTTVFATVVVERVVDMVTLIAIFGVVMLVHPIGGTEAGGLVRKGATAMVLASVGLTVAVVVLERRPSLAHALIGLLAGRLPAGARHRATAMLNHFVEGLSLFRDLPRLLWVFFLSFVMFWLFALCLQVAMWAFAIPQPWYAGLVMLVITAIGIMVPAAPGYIGTMHIACKLGLQLFGVEAQRAVPFSWFYWAGQWGPITLVGLYYLRREGLSLRSLGEAGKGEG